MPPRLAVLRRTVGTRKSAATFSGLLKLHLLRMSGGNGSVRVLLFKGVWLMRRHRGICFAWCAGMLMASVALAQTSPPVDPGTCQSLKSISDRVQPLEYGKPVAHELDAGSNDEYCL